MEKRKIQLKKFKNEEFEKKKKIYISIVVSLFFLVAGIIVYRTFSLFEKNVEQPLVDATITDNSLYDVSVLLSENYVFTSKTVEQLLNEGGSVSQQICSNGASIALDTTTQKISISNLTRSGTVCQLNFN